MNYGHGFVTCALSSQWTIEPALIVAQAMFGMAAYMRALSFASTDTITVPFQVIDPRGLSASALEDELRQRKQALADSAAGARPSAAQMKLTATNLKEIGSITR